MTGVIAGLWGLFGGFAVEGLEFYAVWQNHRCWPWHVSNGDNADASGKVNPERKEAGLRGYVVAEAVRLLIGAGLAWATATTGQISGPLGALGVGVAAPVIIGQLARAIPLDDKSAPSAPTAPTNGQAHAQPGISEPSAAASESSESAMATKGEG
jgi:hypothetical protein